jgi:hypothetical protein
VTEQACRLASAHPCTDEPAFKLQDLDIHLLAGDCDMLVKSVPCPQGNKQPLVYPGVSMLKHYSVILPSKYYVWHKSHKTRLVSAVPKETKEVAAHSIFGLSK